MITQQRHDVIIHSARRFRWHLVGPFVLAVVDVALIYGAFITAYWIRYSWRLGPAIQEEMSFSAYQPLALMLEGVMIPVLFLKGAYRTRLGDDLVDEAATVIGATTITVASIVVVTAMAHQYLYSRGVIVYVWVLVVAFLVLGRSLFRRLRGICHRRGLAIRRVIVVGTTDAARMAMQRMQDRPDYGLRLEGFVYQSGAIHVQNFGRFKALGTVDVLPDLLHAHAVDEVIIALPASAHEEMWPILDMCERHGVDLKIIPDLFEMNLNRVQMDDIGGIPLLEVRERPSRRAARAVKRVLDLSIGGLLFLLSLPLLGILSLLIRLESKGPALLRQSRVGVDGRRFVFYKLRTMRSGAQELRATLEHLNDTQGPLFKIKDDPRRTRVGRVIRQWSLDELPNLINVLKGDMSLVGPRPPLPSEVDLYEKKQLRRLEIKPGLTGIWQVSGRSNLSFDEMLMMDIYYVENWSLGLDVKILIRTIGAVLSRHGAY